MKFDNCTLSIDFKKDDKTTNVTVPLDGLLECRTYEEFRHAFPEYVKDGLSSLWSFVMDPTDKIIQEIIQKNQVSEVYGRVDDLKTEFVDMDDLEEYDDLEELYEETGRNGAECQVMQELLEPYSLDGDDYNTVYEAVQNHYELVTR